MKTSEIEYIFKNFIGTIFKFDTIGIYIMRYN